MYLEEVKNDVLSRYYQVANTYNAKYIVRITGDCPLVDSYIVDKVINLFHKNNTDYCSNINPPTFPHGLDVEIFKMGVLKLLECNQSERKGTCYHLYDPVIRV